MGPSYTMVDMVDRVRYFHEWCSPDALVYQRRPYPDEAKRFACS
jgi:hypothetical protein